jgi:maleylpyruvate isomerase
MKLHTYFRSSASFRVRIALNLKGIAYDAVPAHLVKNGGAQFTPEFTALNAQQLLPVLQTGEGELITQSLAIMEWLEETYPTPALMPRNAIERARVRALSLAIACEIHPLNNLRVLKYLTKMLGVAEEAKDNWYRHWVEQGLAQFEAMLASSKHTGDFCHGNTPTMADCCLVPQIFNARRFNSQIDHLTHTMRIFNHCMTLPAFKAAEPTAQPDAE